MASQKGYVIKAVAKTPKIKIEADTKKGRQEAVAALVSGVHKAAIKIESFLPPLLNKAMESDVWSWPRQTLRKNGSTAGLSRDIVDTGRLRDSLSVDVKFMKTQTNFMIKYSAPYAAIVHEGGYVAPYGRTDLPTRSIPARPWITAAIEGGYPGIQALNIEAEMMISIREAW